jgi:hypothetical protein
MNPPATAPPLPLRIIRADKIRAERIIAGVVHARKFEATTATIGTRTSALPILEGELGRDNLKVDELRADVLYAGEIRTQSAEITTAHVEELKVKNLNGSDQ